MESWDRYLAVGKSLHPTLHKKARGHEGETGVNKELRASGKVVRMRQAPRQGVNKFAVSRHSWRATSPAARLKQGLTTPG